jgi:hypothetical protein
MYEVRLDLQRVPTTALAPNRSLRRDVVTVVGMGLTCLVAILLFSSGWPIMSMLFLASTSVAMAMVEARSHRDEIMLMPELIAAQDIRTLYRNTLTAFDELDRVVGETPRLANMVVAVRDHARAAVATAGRLAMLSNPLTEYLGRHDIAFLRLELDRLQAVAATSEPDSAAALTRAVAARAQQLSTYEEMTARRAQICGRLEALRASLEATTAAAVSLSTLDEDLHTGANEQLTEQIGPDARSRVPGDRRTRAALTNAAAAPHHRERREDGDREIHEEAVDARWRAERCSRFTQRRARCARGRREELAIGQIPGECESSEGDREDEDEGLHATSRCIPKARSATRRSRES